jgi:hypothetical protein
LLERGLEALLAWLFVLRCRGARSWDGVGPWNGTLKLVMHGVLTRFFGNVLGGCNGKVWNPSSGGPESLRKSAREFQWMHRDVAFYISLLIRRSPFALFHMWFSNSFSFISCFHGFYIQVDVAKRSNKEIRLIFENLGVSETNASQAANRYHYYMYFGVQPDTAYSLCI